ncbi:Vicilin-like seed storage protein [Thalictrum thalictroides]|uniref:Vicilin-like seed storage protein n=1 Tax=Thalictrum thalictroides TaxID=46969 RepID=A0A7J6W8P1_THATH|nr:Vicilin-like seed storage protein [Thalictrum thalictroides]
MLKNNITCFSFFLLLEVLFISNCVIATTNLEKDVSKVVGPLVQKEKRHAIAHTEYGQISAVEISDGIKGPYQLQFITLEPNSLFLPVLLHADMVFYVQTGSGSFSWVDDSERNQIDVKKGVIYRIRTGSVFFIKSSLEFEREKLRICAIFTNPHNIEYSHQFYSEPYIMVSELITGFDKKVLQAAFQVSAEVIDNLTRTSKPPPIVHAPSKNTTDQSDWTTQIFEALTGVGSYEFENKKKKSTKTFNILDKKPDFQNCNGWSKTVNRKDMKALKGSDIGVFMVNLTQGSMMGPHWNPRASEIAVVLHGQGMVRVVCSSMGSVPECKNMRFRVKEGDVFAVPRFHPMAQMAYNNDTFVFMGFSTMGRQNYPQFLTGKSSVLQTLDRDVLAISFNVPNVTIDQLLSSQADSIILECLSCAEEEEMRMEEDIEREKQEEAQKKKEEEAQRRQEEEEAARKQEEDRRRQEEEAARKKQEEDRRRQEEEAARKQTEEARRQQEEEAARKEEEEEAARKEEEDRRRQEEEAARKEEEDRRRQEEEQAARKAAEEQQREEEARRQQEQEEVARRQQEQEEAARRQEEEREREGRGEHGGTWKIFNS